MAKQTLDLTILAATSMGASFNTPGIDVSQYYTYSIQVNIGVGDSVGTMLVQVSDDNTNWSDYPESSNTIDSASATTDFWEVIVVGHRWVRVKYTRSSGTTGTAAFIAHLVKES